MHINRGGFLERRKREKMASLEKDFTKRKIVSQDIYVSPRKHVFFTFLKVQALDQTLLFISSKFNKIIIEQVTLE